MSASFPSTRTSSLFAGLETPSISTSPLATTPAARPATVPSSIAGKTLLVPVEIGTMGTQPTLFAAARLVPSPPRVTMQPTPASTIISVALTVSDSSPRTAMSRRSVRSPSGAESMALRARPTRSGIRTARSTPVAANPAITRRIVLIFSWSEMNRP